MKAMLAGVFPTRAFSTRYAIKDLSYALEMADDAGLDMAAARLAMTRLQQAVEQGYGEEYHPVVLKVIDPA
jgi:3-hydroxyisobutyrate dehydrogenase-like beta-hydroxyacid dehydrogenase